MLWDPFQEPPPECQDGVLSIGNFDGVHRGHARLLATLRSRSRHPKRRGIAVGFEPHPLSILRPDRAPVALLTSERKVRLLKAGGADEVLLIRTTPEFLALSAEEFIQRIILGALRAAGLVEGRNFGFGHDRAGNVELLERVLKPRGVFVDVAPLMTGDGLTVSSTRVREFLQSGEVAEAARLLGRPHRIVGNVGEGERRGRQLGFPTANLIDAPVQIPGEGVYAGRCLLRGRPFAVAINIGPNPTFEQQVRKIEAHLIDYSGDLYGQTLEIDLFERLRMVTRFANKEALVEQLQQDVDHARAIDERHDNVSDLDLALESTLREWIGQQSDATGSIVARSFRSGNLTLERFERPLTTDVESSRWRRFSEHLQQSFPEVDRITWIESEAIQQRS